MFKHGDAVQHKTEKWIGVVIGDPLDGGETLDISMFRNERGELLFETFAPNFPTRLADPESVQLATGYEFEAALALGDTGKALELYRASQAALEPFAAYGKLKHPYAGEAVFTIAYDRDGNAVKILFSDFTRAAELLPTASGRTSAPKTDGAVGGIAEIANDATVNAVLDDLDPTGQLKADWQALRGEES